MPAPARGGDHTMWSTNIRLLTARPNHGGDELNICIRCMKGSPTNGC
jgi:hypothetical protein